MVEVGYRYEVHERTPEGVRVWLVHEDQVDDILENNVGPGNYYEVHRTSYLEKREVVEWIPRKKEARKAVIIPFPSAQPAAQVQASPEPVSMAESPSSIRFHSSPTKRREESGTCEEPVKVGERRVQQRCVSCTYEWQARFHTDCPACHEDRFRGVEVLGVDWGV